MQDRETASRAFYNLRPATLFKALEKTFPQETLFSIGDRVDIRFRDGSMWSVTLDDKRKPLYVATKRSTEG